VLIREDTVAGILHEEESLRIVATPLDKAQAALAGQWPCEIAGAALNVRAAKADAPEIARRLVAAQVEVFSLAPHERSLEEAFLAITQSENGNA
jgi:ABC-2 type transport system ATP-binding protein